MSRPGHDRRYRPAPCSIASGVTFASLPVLGVAGALDVATTAQDLGYHSFWTAETVGAEAYSLLTAVGAVAPGLDLGTGVLALQLRTPQLAAMGAATLQALHPDREIYLGIGISSPVVTSQWHGAPYGDRPLARVREYVALVRECLSGEAVSFQGDFWSATRFRLGVRLGERRPKIVVGALNEGMLRVAGEMADGVLLNYVPASHVGWSVEQVRKGGDATIMAYVHAGAVADRADGIDAARRDLYSYAVVDSYAASFTPRRLRRRGRRAPRALQGRRSRGCRQRRRAIAWSTTSTSWARPRRCAPSCRPTSTPAWRCPC